MVQFASNINLMQNSMKQIVTIIIVIAVVLIGWRMMGSSEPEMMDDDMGDEMPAANTAETNTDGDTGMTQASPLPLPAGQYAIAEGSTLGYTGSKVVGNSHTGTVDISEGAVTISEDGSLVTGSFTMDMTSITDGGGSAGYLKHVMSEDFFWVETFPTAAITLASVEHREGDQYIVVGDLNIKGIVNGISFPATITETEAGLEATASFTIDRTRWNVTYGSGSFFDDLGDNVIKDEIDIELNLSFTKQ